MTSLSENPAVLDPHKTLTPSQKEALCAIGFYRHNRPVGAGKVQIGNKRFQKSTIIAILRHELIGGEIGASLHLTIAGQIARDRLQGKRT